LHLRKRFPTYKYIITYKLIHVNSFIITFNFFINHLQNQDKKNMPGIS